MKKLLLIAFSILILIPLASKTASAQGTFGCSWRPFPLPGIPQCYTPPSSPDTNCEDGYDYYDEYCQQCADSTTCDDAALTTCILDDSDPPSPLPPCVSGPPACPTPGVCTSSCNSPDEPQDQFYCETGVCCWPEGEPLPEVYENLFRPQTCEGGEGILTALGCISGNPSTFVYKIRNILLGIGSGITLILMIVGAFFVLSSQGNPEQIKRGKEIFVGALIGLLVLIFSTFLLELIGVDILGLFNRSSP